MDAAAVQASYEGVRGRVVALMDEHRGALDARLPASPEWTAHDLLRHLAGVATDLTAGDVDDYASEAWTERQRVALGSASVDEVIDCWQKAAAQLPEAPSTMGIPALELALGDAVVHEADLAAAIAPGHRVPDEDVALAIKTGVARWRAVLGAWGVPSLRIDVPGLRGWWLGQPSDAGVTLEVPAYELFRLLYGRRSRGQVADLEWSSDPAPYLDAGLAYPFAWSELALRE